MKDLFTAYFNKMQVLNWYNSWARTHTHKIWYYYSNTAFSILLSKHSRYLPLFVLCKWLTRTSQCQSLLCGGLQFCRLKTYVDIAMWQQTT
jgi:hypothetical protein